MTKTYILVFFLLIIIGLLAHAEFSQNTQQPKKTNIVVQKPTPTNVPKIASIPISPRQIPLTITSPLSGSSANSALITVLGITEPNADVFINDREVVADSKGNFSQKIHLLTASNTVVIAANDADGNYNQKNIIVYGPNTIQTFPTPSVILYGTITSFGREGAGFFLINTTSYGKQSIFYVDRPTVLDKNNKNASFDMFRDGDLIRFLGKWNQPKNEMDDVTQIKDFSEELQ